MDSADAHNQEDGPKRKTETIAFLRNATLLLVDSFNKRQFNDNAPPWSIYCHSTFASEKTSSFSGQNRASTLQEHTARLRELSIRHPRSQHRLVESSVVVDMVGGTATVHGIVAIVDDGNPPRQSIGKLEWKRFDGRWLCTKHAGLQGMAGGDLVGGSMNSIDDWHEMTKWR